MDHKKIYFYSLFWEFGKYLYTNFAAGSWVNIDKALENFGNTYRNSSNTQRQDLLKRYLQLTRCLLIQNAILLSSDPSDETQEYELSIVWSKVFISDFTNFQQTSKLASQILKNSYPNSSSQNDEKQQTNQGGTRRRLRPRVPKKVSNTPTKSEHEGTRAAKAIGYLGLQLLKILKDQILTRDQLMILTGFSKQRVCTVLSIYQGVSIIEEDTKTNLLKLNPIQAKLLPDLRKYLKQVVKIRKIKRMLAKYTIYLTLKYKKHGIGILTQTNMVDENFSQIISLILSKIKSNLSITDPIENKEQDLDKIKFIKSNLSTILENNKKMKKSLFEMYIKDCKMKNQNISNKKDNIIKAELITEKSTPFKNQDKNDNILTPLDQIHSPKENFQQTNVKIKNKKKHLTNKLLNSKNMVQNIRNPVIIPLETNTQTKLKSKQRQKKKIKKVKVNLKKQDETNKKEKFNKSLLHQNNKNINMKKNNRTNSTDSNVDDDNTTRFTTTNNNNSKDDNFTNNSSNSGMKTDMDIEYNLDYKNQQANTVKKVKDQNANNNLLENQNDQGQQQQQQQHQQQQQQQQNFVHRNYISVPFNPKFQQHPQFMLNTDFNPNNKMNNNQNLYLSSINNPNNFSPFLPKYNMLPKIKLSPSLTHNTNSLQPSSPTLPITPNITSIFTPPFSTIMKFPATNNPPNNHLIKNNKEKEKEQKKTDLNTSLQKPLSEQSKISPKVNQQTQSLLDNTSRNLMKSELRNNQQSATKNLPQLNNGVSPNSLSPFNRYSMRYPNYLDTSSPYILSPFLGNYNSPLQYPSPIGFKNSPSISPYLSLNTPSTPSSKFQHSFSGLQSLSLSKYNVSEPQKKIEKSTKENYETSFNKK
ncbi:nnp-1 protein putative nuclear protein 1 nop52 [Anaeramoeba flamelloides]|uniref:Nnp-1 protein putative nuclear protein 1 nop52 n=1 Tax=Anaeramoeba flamelloides TaxID=1746091 RepID=A0ABQ8Y302_9EUKA|nr:nnp-1 protein putative nuclear protein 1 nop52 [Anaeramoeba flamelloides]